MNLSDGKTSRQCTATSKRSGERCRMPPVRGATVCRIHGGAAPQVRAKARQRLMELAEPAVVLLGRILRDESVAAADRIRAAIAVLDRTGFPAGLKIEAELDARLPGWQAVLGNLFDRQQSEVERRKVTADVGPPVLELEAEARVIDQLNVEVAGAEPAPWRRRYEAPVTSADDTLPQHWQTAEERRAKAHPRARFSTPNA